MTGLADPAAAHATLVASNPTQGATLATPPTQVDFEFSEQISPPAYVVVNGPDGNSVVTGEPQVSGNTVSQAVTASAEGSYTMAYRAVSADGHPITGQISFHVGAASQSEAASGSPEAEATAASSQKAGGETTTTTSTTAATVSEGSGFWERHWSQVLIGMLLWGGAAGLFAASRRRPEAPTR